MPTLPKTPEEVTVSFLKDVLAAQPWAAHIMSISFSQNELQGQTSEVVVFSVTYVPGALSDAPNQLIFKFASSGRGFVTREHCVEIGSYKKEVGFYQYLLKTHSPLLENFCPAIYYAEIDMEDQDQFLLIMAKSGTPLDQLNELPLPIARKAMAKLASLHATFWYTKDQEEALYQQLHANGLIKTVAVHAYLGEFLVDPTKDYTHDVYGMLEDTKKQFAAKFADYSEALHHFISLRKLDKFEKNLRQLQADYQSGELIRRIEKAHLLPESVNRTLVHADFRPDNFIVNANDELIIVDYQGICFGNGGYDLAMFLAHSFEDQSHAEELLDLYWTDLLVNNPEIAKLYSKEQFMDDVKHSVLFHVIMLTFYCYTWKAMLDKGQDPIQVMSPRVWELMFITTGRIFNLYCHFFGA